MIAYGVCVGSDDTFMTHARPGLARHAHRSSPIAECRGQTSIFKAYNRLLDEFASCADLEALVLLHDDLEVRDPNLERRLREGFSDSRAAVLGVVGAVGVSELAWWNAQGRGRCLETRGLVDFGSGRHTVDAVDGCFLALSPWAVRNLRFDELNFSGFHGYDMDICFQARHANHRVLVIDLDVFHHTKGGYGDVESFQRADSVFRRKWITR